MDLNKLLKKENCVCGKEHYCKISAVYIEDGAINKLENLTLKYSSALIVADENTYKAAGKKVENALKAKKVKKVVFSGDSILIPDENAISKVIDNLCDVDIIIGIGAGVIQDLCKYVSSTKNIPYIIVATAPSMDGYASDGAAMIMGGMKITYKATVPLAIIAEPSILKDAPFDMIQAGYGDIIGKYSALNDWELSNVVNGEYLCSYIFETTMDTIKGVESCAEGLKNRDKKSVQMLMEALVLVGIMMSFAGSSRPASGSEHHMAHFFEITGILDNKPYLPHGIDVGYSTVITAKVREEILNSKWSFKRGDDTTKRSEDLKRIYKTSCEKCEELQAKIGNYNIDIISTYIKKEEEIKRVLRKMPSASEIERLLKNVGLEMSEYYNLYGKEKIDTAIKYSKDLKDRYTVFWLYYYFNKRKGVDYSKIKVIALDLDGTLTQHRQPLPKENIEALEKLAKKYKLLMVGAGQVKRIFKQMDNFPIDIIGNYGMQYGIYDKSINDIVIVKDNKVGVDRGSVIEKITELRQKYGYTDFKGDTVEFHPTGCLTFAILGTNADKNDKIAFDPDRKKRRAIYHDVVNSFSNYEVFVGGSSSFDMAPKGFNKYYALKDFINNNGYSEEEILFIGDDYGYGGNDESVYLSNIPFMEIDNFLNFSEQVKILF